MKVQLAQTGFQIATPTELQLTLHEYLIAIEADDLSPATVIQYRWHLEKLTAWLAIRGIETPQGLSEKLLRQWAISIRNDNGWGPSTRKQAISACKSFFRWCRQEQIIDIDPAQVLKPPRPKRRQQRVLSTDEIQHLLDHCQPTPTGIRDKAIISLLFDSGLRSAELCRLKLSDVDLETKSFKVIVKGAAEEPGLFGNRTRQRIRDWLTVREIHARPSSTTLFVSIRGTRPGTSLTTHGLRAILRKNGHRADIDHVSPHAFRRAFAVTSIEAGAPDELVMRWGRWRSTSVFREYVATVNASKLYPKFSPVDRLQP